MAQPNRYEPQAGFAEQTRNNVPGRSPINARALDDELSGISQSINGIVGNLELIQRDDGSLKDATVHLHALGESVLNLMGGFNLRGEWQANTSYAAKDIVDYQGHLFVCMTANQDAVFTAANWHRFGEKGAELHQVLRQVAHMQTQVQEEGRKALQAAAQTKQAAAQVASQAGTVDASAQQAAASARAAKVSADAAEQSRIRAEAAAANAEGAVNNVTGKLATKLDTDVFNEFKGKAATKEELEEKTGNALAGKADKNHTHYQLITDSQQITVPPNVSLIFVTLIGGGGGRGGWKHNTWDDGGNGARQRACIAVSAGDVLDITIGAGGYDAGWGDNGGGGGGISKIARAGQDLLACNGGGGGLPGWGGKGTSRTYQYEPLIIGTNYGRGGGRGTGKGNGENGCCLIEGI